MTASPQDALLQRAIARAKEGDTSALHFLYARFADDVCAYVRSIVHDPHDAEDITQNVFAKLLTAVQHYEQREVPFAAWILRVARNAALDYIRAQRAVPCEEVRGADAGHNQIGHDLAQALRKALEHLPDDQCEVLVLRHLAGFSPWEIADQLKKTEGSIHGLHHRGRGTLQAALRELEVAPMTAS